MFRIPESSIKKVEEESDGLLLAIIQKENGTVLISSKEDANQGHVVWAKSLGLDIRDLYGFSIRVVRGKTVWIFRRSVLNQDFAADWIPRELKGALPDDFAVALWRLLPTESAKPNFSPPSGRQI